MKRRKVTVYLREEDYNVLKEYCRRMDIPLAVFLKIKALEAIRKEEGGK